MRFPIGARDEVVFRLKGANSLPSNSGKSPNAVYCIVREHFLVFLEFAFFSHQFASDWLGENENLDGIHACLKEKPPAEIRAGVLFTFFPTQHARSDCGNFKMCIFRQEMSLLVHFAVFGVLSSSFSPPIAYGCVCVCE